MQKKIDTLSDVVEKGQRRLDNLKEDSREQKEELNQKKESVREIEQNLRILQQGGQVESK